MNWIRKAAKASRWAFKILLLNPILDRDLLKKRKIVKKLLSLIRPMATLSCSKSTLILKINE
jgi:hypothetical protein